MGLETTRPVEVSKKILEIGRLISQKEFILARQNIIELKNKIGEDPELVKASVLIKRMELIGK